MPGGVVEADMTRNRHQHNTTLCSINPSPPLSTFRNREREPVIVPTGRGLAPNMVL